MPLESSHQHQTLFSSIPSTYARPPPQPQRSSGYGVSPNVITVNKRQEGNPLLRHIRSVRWQFDPSGPNNGPDYQLGDKTCAIFVSVRYHLLHPDYVLRRIKEQQPGRVWGLIIILCHCDCEDAMTPLAEITRAAVLNGCTLVCAWSPEECARYLETFKSYESKPAYGIQERVDQDHASRLHNALSEVRGVNKNDSVALYAARGTVADIFRSRPEQLSSVPGIGPTKVQRLIECFNEPFKREVVNRPIANDIERQEALAPGVRADQQGAVIPQVMNEERQEVLDVDDEGEEEDEEMVQATQILAAGCEQEIDMQDEDEDVG